MAYYMVSHDLRRELNEADYERLHEHIRPSFSDGHGRLNPSGLSKGRLARPFMTRLPRKVDENDGLIVAELSGSLCFAKTQEEFDKTEEEAETNGWLRARFACR